MKKIGTHDGSFHADDVLAVFLLKNTEEFRESVVIRSRDQEILQNCDCVLDVGGEYNHEKRRYDHHQTDFKMTYPGFSVPLASCGLIFFHYGPEIVTNVLKKSGRSAENHVEYLCREIYSAIIKEIDAIDNGYSQVPNNGTINYRINTGISSRIGALNPLWRDPNPDYDDHFRNAVRYVGEEFTTLLNHLFDSDVPAIDLCQKAYSKRYDYHPSGQIIVFDAFVPFDKHLKRIEHDNPESPLILYSISPRTDGTYSIKALGTGSGFELRKALPFPGLRAIELSEKSGIEGGVFVHKTGFTGAFATYEGAFRFAVLALERVIEGVEPTEKKAENTIAST